MRFHRAIAYPASVRLGGPHPLNFGRSRRWLLDVARQLPDGVGDNLRLFGTAYLAGFLGVSLYIA